MSFVAERPRVLILTGSVRTPSYTRALSRAVSRTLTSLGANVIEWDAREPLLPIADPEYHKSASTHPDPSIVRLDAEARSADAFVLATPVYHNSFSGVLKNTLDHLNIEPHFRSKPVGLISYGGDRSTQAVDQLRIVTRGLNAIAIPTQVCTQRADFSEQDGGIRLVDAAILDRVRRFSEELATYAVVLRPLRHPSTVQNILKKFAPEEVETEDEDQDGIAAAQA